MTRSVPVDIAKRHWDRRDSDPTFRSQKDAVFVDPKVLVPAVDWGEYGLPYCSIYVITTQDYWPCKIGISSSPLSRVAALQTSHWKRLIVWGALWTAVRRDALRLEKRAHKSFAEDGKLLLGEWFDARPEKALEVLKFLGSVEGIELSDEFPSDEVRDSMVAKATKRFESRADTYPIRLQLDDTPLPMRDARELIAERRRFAYDLEPARCKKEMLSDKLRRQQQEDREFMRE